MFNDVGSSISNQNNLIVQTETEKKKQGATYLYTERFSDYCLESFPDVINFRNQINQIHTIYLNTLHEEIILNFIPVNDLSLMVISFLELDDSNFNNLAVDTLSSSRWVPKKSSEIMERADLPNQKIVKEYLRKAKEKTLETAKKQASITKQLRVYLSVYGKDSKQFQDLLRQAKEESITLSADLY